MVILAGPMDRWGRNILCLLVGLCIFTVSPVSAQYPSYAQIETDLLAAETNYPNLCKRHYLGDTGSGRSMWALRISDNVLVEEDLVGFE